MAAPEKDPTFKPLKRDAVRELEDVAVHCAQQALLVEQDRQGVSDARMAALLGLATSELQQRMKSNRLQLRSVAQVAAALGCRVRIELEPIERVGEELLDASLREKADRLFSASIQDRHSPIGIEHFRAASALSDDISQTTATKAFRTIIDEHGSRDGVREHPIPDDFRVGDERDVDLFMLTRSELTDLLEQGVNGVELSEPHARVVETVAGYFDAELLLSES